MMSNMLARMLLHPRLMESLRGTMLQFLTAIDSSFLKQIREVSSNPLQSHQVGAVRQFFENYWSRA